MSAKVVICKIKYLISKYENSILSMFGAILIRSIDLISIPIFTRLMETSTYGRLSVFSTYVYIFIVFLGLDFYGAVGKGTLVFKEKCDKYYSVSVSFTFFWFIFVLFVFNVSDRFISHILLLKRSEYNILLIYSYGMFVVNYATSKYLFFQEYKKNILMSFFLASTNLILSVFFIMSIFADNMFFGRILGYMIPTTLVASVLLVNFWRRGKKIYDKSMVGFSLRFGIPLIPHNLSHLILSNSDRIMIQYLIGDSQSGIYSLAYNIGLMMQVVTEGANNYWNPLLFRRLENDERDTVKNQARLYLVLYTMIAIGATVVSPEIIKILSSDKYWGGIDIAMWICLSTYFTFVYQLYVNVEFYHAKTYLISIGTIFAAIVNITLNVWGLPIYGYTFAAISTVISYALLIVFHCFSLNILLKDHVIDNLFTLMLAFIVFVVTCFFNFIRHSYIIRYIGLVLVEGILVLLLVVMVKIEKKIVKDGL